MMITMSDKDYVLGIEDPKELLLKARISQELLRCMRLYMKEHKIKGKSEMVRFCLRKEILSWWDNQRSAS